MPPSSVGTGIQYNYISGPIFYNSGQSQGQVAGYEVWVENNAGLPDILYEFPNNGNFTLDPGSTKDTTPQNVEAYVKFILDTNGDFKNNTQYPKTGTPIAGEVPEYGDYGQALTPFLEKLPI